MRRHAFPVAFLLIAIVASVPSGTPAIEGKRDVIDEDHYGQGEFVGYRANLPARQYPEHAYLPYQSADQAYLVPDTLRATLQAGQSVEEHKILYLPEDVAPAKGDIIFSFDITGSMGNAINEVKTNASAIMDSVRALIPDTYFGVISHQDYPAFYDYCGYAEAYGNPDVGDSPYVLDQPLTGNLVAVHGAINGLTLGDGADGPESYARVLFEATEDDAVGWRSGSTKMVILWGDNVPHDCDYRLCIGGSGTKGVDPGRDEIAGTADDLPILPVITGMALNDIVLLAMYNGLSSTNLSLWNCWAKRTGGEAFEVNPDGTVPGGEDLPSYIAGIISAQFTEIDVMTLEVCQPEFAHWLNDVNPVAYYDIVLDQPHELHFDITITVPEGTPAGLYCFDICAIGDGAIYATQNVCIRVQPGGCIDLEIGCVYGADPYQPIIVPVYGGDFDDWGADNLSIEICWCDDFMDLVSCSPGEVLNNAGWTGSFCEATGTNCITFHAAGGTPLSGSGTLFTLEFYPTSGAAPCECCSLTFGEIFIGDFQVGLPVCPVECEVCMASCSVEGYVFNWYCTENGEITRTHPIEGADVILDWCGTPQAGRVTDSEGYYLFDCLPQEFECPWCVTAQHPPIPGNIRAYDASLILQYTVGALDLMDCALATDGGPVYPQRVAGDVSCAGGLGAYDASIILQYVVHYINSWPCGYFWEFIRSDDCDWECNKRVDFMGVLLGDVSGPMPPPPADPDQVPVWLDVPTHYSDMVEVVIKMKNGANICAGEFTIEFDHDALQFDTAAGVGVTDGFMVVTHEPSNGVLNIAIAGSSCVSGSGRTVKLTFIKKRMPMPVVEPMIELTAALFNEGMPEAVIKDKDWKEEVHGLITLGPVSPNPFAMGTDIRFNLPSAAAVRIDIYDVTGQLVRTLVEGHSQAGTHSIGWDGTDSSGDRVARGVYFVRMAAGEFRASEKVVLLK
jgi:hypothetical protein